MQFFLLSSVVQGNWTAMIWSDVANHILYGQRFFDNYLGKHPYLGKNNANGITSLVGNYKSKSLISSHMKSIMFVILKINFVTNDFFCI